MISVQALVFPLFSAQEWWGRPTIHLSLTLQKTVLLFYFLVSIARKSSFDLLEGAPAPPSPASPPFVESGAAAPATAPAAAVLFAPTGLRTAPLVDRALRSARGLIAALFQ